MQGEKQTGSLYERLSPGDDFTLRVESWARDVELTTLSPPSTDHIGFFAEEVVEDVDGEPWMCTATGDETNLFVFIMGGDGAIRVAFGRTAAEAGVYQTIEPSAFFIE